MPNRPYARVPSLKELSDFDGAFDRAFSLVAFVLNRHIIDHLLRATRLLTDGDAEALMIWGVLAHLNVAHLMPPGSVPAAILDAQGHLPDEEARYRPLRLRDLTDITGIPRETVRRKLNALAAQHYVQRAGNGWVLCTDRVEPELREFTRESVWRLLAVADEIRAALRAADAGSAGVRPSSSPGKLD